MISAEKVYNDLNVCSKHVSNLAMNYHDLPIDVQQLLDSYAAACEEETFGQKKEHLDKDERKRIVQLLDSNVSKIYNIKESLKESSLDNDEVIQILEELDEDNYEMLSELDS